MFYSSVLLITNNSALIKSISNYLEEKGLTVKNSNDQEDFIKKIQKDHPDIIIVDAKTKNLAAQVICKDIKERFTDIPQIVLAENDELAHLNKFLSIPIKDFIVKPISPSALYLRIKKILKKNSKDPKSLENGDLKLDDKRKQVILNGETISVSPKEYRLLRYLILNRGKVLSRNAILNHVWGYNSYVIDRNVDVYVGYIRKKLGDNKKFKYIKTVPSFGYMMKKLD